MCLTLQVRVFGALGNVICNNGADKAKTIESGGIDVLLAATTHLGFSNFCERACCTLYNIVRGSKENTGLLISLGGAKAVANVRTKWPDDDKVQTKVKRLTKLIVLGAEMSNWM